MKMRWLWIWLIVLVSVASARWILPYHWHRFLMRKGEFITKTIDCQSEKEDGEIDVAKRNARRVFDHGFAQVLVSTGDGCYHLFHRFKLFAIRRSPKTKAIVSRHYWGEVRVSMIIGVKFWSLIMPRRRYALKKFGPNAPSRPYNLVTLSAISQAARGSVP